MVNQIEGTWKGLTVKLFIKNLSSSLPTFVQSEFDLKSKPNFSCTSIYLSFAILLKLLLISSWSFLCWPGSTNWIRCSSRATIPAASAVESELPLTGLVEASGLCSTMICSPGNNRSTIALLTQVQGCPRFVAAPIVIVLSNAPG